MAESGLSIGFPDLQGIIGKFLNYGSVSANWTATQTSEINDVIQSGVRRVYYPPAIDANNLGYEWSFLRPTTTLAIVADDGDYDLPDDLGRLIGTLHYPADEHRNSIVIVSVSKLLQMRACSDTNGAPRYAAIRYKSSIGDNGQRQEILFYPEPDNAWTLSYEYEAYNGPITASYPYPLGGMQLAELYIESCLAIAESRLNDEIGQHTAQYKVLLMDAVARDKKRGARYYGQMGHKEEGQSEFRRGWTGSTYSITYNGNQISGGA